MLAEKLNMTPEEAERWIVNLIRNAKLDAKIDSKLVIKLCLLWKKKIQPKRESSPSFHFWKDITMNYVPIQPKQWSYLAMKE